MPSLAGFANVGGFWLLLPFVLFLSAQRSSGKRADHWPVTGFGGFFLSVTFPRPGNDPAHHSLWFASIRDFARKGGVPCKHGFDRSSSRFLEPMLHPSLVFLPSAPP
ncbi:hypothetical protein V2G26_008312 [Clonostachys chloroleuca]